mgnify:CR=1 FL=1
MLVRILCLSPKYIVKLLLLQFLVISYFASLINRGGGVGKYDYLGVPIGCKTTYNKNQWKESFEIIEEVEF